MKSKRGQFYLVAAIMIVLVLFSLAGITTYSLTKPEQKTFDRISSGLGEESPRIISYGVYSGKNLTSVIENFTEKDFANYFSLTAEPMNATFVYGNATNVYVVNFAKEQAGAVCTGQSCVITHIPHINKTSVSITPGKSSVDVQIIGKKYTFELSSEQMFYFVVSSEKEGEKYIETNEDIKKDKKDKKK
jgi:hypothetical protein